MADNTVLPAGTGGDTIATDDLTTLNGGAVSGFKVQRIKVGFGSDSVLRDVDASNPLPVADAKLTDGTQTSKLTDGTTTALVSTLGEQFVSFKDLVPTSQGITVQDTGSTSAAGANGQNIISGTPTAGSTASATVTGDSSFAVQVSGTWTGTLQFERSLDAGTSWTSIGAFAAGTAFIVPTTTANGNFHGNASSATTIRVRATAAVTGTATLKILAGAGVGTITIGNPLRLFDKASGVEHTIKAGSTAAAAGDTAMVVAVRDAVAVTGTFYQATQPVSMAANTPDVTDRSGRLLGTIANTSFAATNAGTFAVQAASTLAAETTKVIGTVNVAAAQTIAVTQATAANLNATVTPQAITKGTQGTTGITVQALNDAGRNTVTYYTLIPVLTSATDTLQSLTGTKSGATVTATTTPAVVTTGKTFRVTRFSATYIATATSGYAIARLRFNTAGVAAITSPIAVTLAVGAGTPATANSADTEDASITEGMEFAAATGIGISVQGFSAATATAVGYMFVSVSGYEY